MSSLWRTFNGYGLLYAVSATKSQRINRLSLLGGGWQMKCEDMILGRPGKESCSNEKARRVRRMAHPPYSIVWYIFPVITSPVLC